MRRLTRWAARLYPRAWKHRHGAEFDALLEDISPSWRDACNVAGRALGTALHLRSAVVIAVITHAMALSFLMVASSAYVAPVSWKAPGAPLPPPAPAPPAEITDPRVFHDASLVYSSLHLDRAMAMRSLQMLLQVLESTFRRSRISGQSTGAGILSDVFGLARDWKPTSPGAYFLNIRSGHMNGRQSLYFLNTWSVQTGRSGF